jgi:hypothetical protein
MTRSNVATILEKIARIIPGITGYQDREKRRDADKSVREKAASSLALCRERLGRVMNDLSRAGGPGSLRSIGRLERISTRLERIEDEIRYAPHGYAGWLDREGVNLEDLERLYEYDLLLLETAERMPDMVGTADSMIIESNWAQELENELAALRLTFENRTQAIVNGGNAR